MELSDEAFDRVYETARALGEETRFRIYRQLCLSDDPVSVTDLAKSFSLHPNAIRQHLSRLEQAELVVSRTHRVGGAGRPRRIYAARPEPLELKRPRSTVRMVVTMLSEAIDALPADHEVLIAFGQAWGRAWAQRRKRENGAPRTRRARAELLAAELTEWGWEPTTRQENGALRLETGRCLFNGSAPGRNDRCCALEEGLLAGLADSILTGRPSITIEGCQLALTL